MPTFTAPDPPTMPTVLTFTLTVTDTGCLTDSDFIAITIVPPVGGHTEPLGPVALLWPWLLLVAVVTTVAIAALALKRRPA